MSLYTDATNHGNIKFFTVLVRYFIPTVDVFVKILTLTEEAGENSTIISELIEAAASKSLQMTRLEVNTLKAIMTVECNLKYECVQFYNYLKTKPEQKDRNLQSKSKAIEMIQMCHQVYQLMINSCIFVSFY